MKRVLTIGLATVILAVATFAGLHLQRSSAEVLALEGEPYPSKPLNSVSVPHKGSGKTLVIQRHKMVTTPGQNNPWRQLENATIFWDEAHGLIIEDQDYYPDLSVSKSVKYFPGKTEEERGGMRRTAFYGKDGKFVKHEVRRKDGTLERQGAFVQKTDQYVQNYYFEDGKTIKRSRIFFREVATHSINVEINGMNQVEIITIPTGKFKLLKEEVFQMTDSGVLPESEVWYIHGSGYFKKVFNAKGEKIGSVSQGADIKEHGEIYSPDGKHLLIEYDLRTGMMPGTMTYFRLDGTMWQSRMMVFGATNILWYDLEGKKVLYKQVWRERPADGPKPAYSILSKVEEFDPLTGQPTTIIHMVNDGSMVDSVMYYRPDGKALYKFLNKDGIVIRIELRNGNQVENVVIPTVQERLVIEPNRFKREDPIKLTDYNFNDPRAPAWLYDYEDIDDPKIGDYIP